MSWAGRPNAMPASQSTPPYPRFRRESAERRFNQDPVKGVSGAGAREIAERGPEIVAEPGLGIGIYAGIKIGFALGERLEHTRQRVHAGRGDGPSDDPAK